MAYILHHLIEEIYFILLGINYLCKIYILD